MTCETCIHWLLRDSRGRLLPMSKHGFGQCASLRTLWISFPPHHACGKHKPAAPEIQAARVVWLNKKG